MHGAHCTWTVHPHLHAAHCTLNGNYNALMLALRYVHMLALVAWLGGMAILGALVAPTTFQVLQAADPLSGRALGGEVFGAIIARFHYVAYAAGGLLLVTMAGMALLGPRPRAFAIRVGLITAMLAVAVYSGVIVLGNIDQVQLDAGGLVSRLAVDDERRIRFDALHRLSTNLMLLNMAGALVLLYWEAREP